MTVYFISGLGIDRRALIKISLKGDFNIKYLEWIAPFKNETLEHYSLRLARGINVNEEFSIVGLSMGGMVATEIAKSLSAKHVILLSSAATRKEIPWYFRFIGKTRLHKIISGKLMKQTSLLTFWMFGTKTVKEKLFLREILKDTSPKFLEWAINSILTWKNTKRPSNLFHIHGDEDRVLPISMVKPDRIIKGGGHLIVFSHSEMVSKMIDEKLST